MKRFGLGVIALVGLASVAQAGVEIGGTAGLHIFSKTNALGDTLTTGEANSAMFGLRLGIYFGTSLGIEGEGGLIPSEPKTMPIFNIYNATYRGHLILEARAGNPSNKLIPFLVAGGGGFAVVKIDDPTGAGTFQKDKRGAAYVGLGAKFRTEGGWGVRIDARVLFVKKQGGGSTEDFEGLASLYREFGRKKAKKEEPAPKNDDPDKDGIKGAADKCPTEAEDKDDFQDDDGCPDLDNDGDGIADKDDKCPTEAEDKDNFQDDDGCPEADNDQDGIPDAADKCPDEPETRNGFQDEDGCADEIPDKLKAFTGTIQGINFKANSADLVASSNKTLDKAVAVLTEFKDVKLEIQGHTDDQAPKKGGKFADNDALSQARAESVKAYFVKKGIDEGRLVAKGYAATAPIQDPTGLKGAKLNAARTVNRRVEFKLVPAEAAAPTETPKDDSKKDEPKKDESKKDDAKKDDAKKDDDAKDDEAKDDAKGDEPKKDAPKKDAPKKKGAKK